MIYDTCGYGMLEISECLVWTGPNRTVMFEQVQRNKGCVAICLAGMFPGSQSNRASDIQPYIHPC